MRVKCLFVFSFFSKYGLDKYMFSVERRKNGICGTFIVIERLTAISGGATCGINGLVQRIFTTYGAFL
jgi:hypothetical protein